MNGRVDFSVDDLVPEPRDVLVAQGVPRGAPVSDRIEGIVDEAIAIFRTSATPVGVVQEVDADTLAEIVEGEGTNAPDPVMTLVAARAGGRALFAATVGEALSRRISGLLADEELALGVALDATASVAADRTAELLSHMFLTELRDRGAAHERDHVLGYSPGYCGWHISGQRKLFEHVRPERIGISLSDRFLMTPTKSVSGVLVSGPTSAHDFQPGFGYCEECRSRSCQPRIRRLHALDQAEGNTT